MHRRLASTGILTLGLCLTCFWLLARPALGTGPAICVGDFPDIQAGIGKAGDGDTVRVPTGTHVETIAISKSIILQGGWNADCSSRLSADPADTIIHADGAGSAVWITGGEPRLEALTLMRGLSDRGGGVRIEGASPTLAHVTVAGNRVDTAADERTRGAGVYVNGGTLTLDHVDIISNTADAHTLNEASGAGLCLEGVGTEAVLVASRIADNGPAPSARLLGGGIYVGPSSRVTAVGVENVIANNTARGGGGIFTYVGISGLTIISNTAENGGGALVYPLASALVANNIFAGNSASSQGCAVMLLSGAEFANNTVVDNVGAACAAVETSSSSSGVVTLTNNIVVGHKVGIADEHGTITHTLVTNNLWDNTTNYQTVPAGATDLHQNPQFLDRAGGDYHLEDGSPMIDAGTDLPLVKEDFDGDPRPIGLSHDIGADEWGLFVYLPLVLRT